MHFLRVAIAAPSLLMMSFGPTVAATNGTHFIGKPAIYAQVQPKPVDADTAAEQDQRRQQIDAIDKRVDDTNSRISDIQYVLTIFGVLIAIVVAFATFVGYFSAARKAEDAAEQWIEKNYKTLDGKLKELEAQAEQRSTEARAKVEAATSNALKMASDAYNQMQTQLDQMALSKLPKHEQDPQKAVEAKLSGDERQALETSEKALRERPEADYTAEDWANRAFSAYASNDLESSAIFFKRAAQAKDASLEQVALALRNRGTVFGLLRRPDEAVATYNELIERFKDAREPAVREQVAIALNNKGVELGNTKATEAIGAYDEIINRFKDDTNPALREQVALALNNKGLLLDKSNSSESASKIFDELVDRFKDASEPPLREQVARALNNKGISLGRKQCREDAIDVYDQVVDRFKGGIEPTLREQVAIALCNKGIMLGQLQRAQEAIAIYDDVIGRLNDSSEPMFLYYLAVALINKGETLGLGGKTAAALETLDDALKRLRETSEAKIQNVLVEAAFARAVTLNWLGRRADALASVQALVDERSSSTNDEVRKFVAKSREYLADPQSDWKYLDGTWD